MVNKVILVTSDKTVVSTVTENLIGNFDITLAENGLQAVEYVQEINPQLVLIDLDIDVSDAIETVSSLREWTSIPIVFLSNSSENLIKFYNTSYLKKTEDKESFRQEILKILSSHEKSLNP